MNEFQIISRYLKSLSNKNREALKLNDDVYYDFKKKYAISVDTYKEGKHFLDSSNPNNFLKKILRASLSDLYCKGIKPKSYFLSLGLDKTFLNNKWMKNFTNILKNEQRKFDIFLGGGDTTRSTKLVITIIVLGDTKNKPVLRTGCKLNDDIYVTGNIADSFLGLNVIKKKINFGKFNNYFKKKYYEPTLQHRLVPYLHKVASSSIDVSDGLAQDLQHLCVNSKCGAFIDLDLLPFSRICQKMIDRRKIKLENIFSKGDDYQILFTSSYINRKKIYKISKKLSTKITRIGIIKKHRDIVFQHNMKKFKINRVKMGYTHIF